MAFKSMSMTGAGALAAPKRVVAAKAAAPACVRASVEAARKSARPRRGCRSPPLVWG